MVARFPATLAIPQIRLNNLKIELDKSGTAAIQTSTTALASNTWTIVIADIHLGWMGSPF